MAKWPYNTQRWQKLRRHKLRQHPLCQSCLDQGRIEPATAVDHVVRIKAGSDPYPPLAELASLCASCHNQKSRGEQLGKAPAKVWGCDVNGMPLDPAHPWNKG